MRFDKCQISSILLFVCACTVSAVVDSYPDSIWSGRGSGAGIPVGGLRLLYLPLLRSVWRELLAAAEPRLRNVFLYPPPPPLHARSPVSLAVPKLHVHTCCLLTCSTCVAANYMYVHVVDSHVVHVWLPTTCMYSVAC